MLAFSYGLRVDERENEWDLHNARTSNTMWSSSTQCFILYSVEEYAFSEVHETNEFVHRVYARRAVFVCTSTLA